MRYLSFYQSTAYFVTEKRERERDSIRCRERGLAIDT